jgi:hypothetical protein
LNYWNEIPEIVKLEKKERFILSHNFRAIISWSINPQALGPVWKQYIMVGELMAEEVTHFITDGK